MDSLILRHNLQTESAENVRFMSKVYVLMSLGLLLSSWLAFNLAEKQITIQFICTTPILFWGIIGGNLIALIYLSAFLKKMELIIVFLTFIGYSLLSALTLSIIFIHFFDNNVHVAFTILAISFFALAILSRIFKLDCGPFGIFFFLGLLEIGSYFLVKLYYPNFYASADNITHNIAILATLTAIISIDICKIKKINFSIDQNIQQTSIHGALTLYSDFINLFLFFLRLSSRK